MEGQMGGGYHNIPDFSSKSTGINKSSFATILLNTLKDK